MARYTDEQWFCHCGEPAKWYDSKKEGSYGDRFIRCPRPRNAQCSFFVWERDEASERQRYQRGSTVPQTPQSVRRTVRADLPTPQTGSAKLENRLAAISFDRETSPTPRKGRGRQVDSEEEVDLYGEVVDLLKSEGVVLKESVKIQLEELVNLRVADYETKLKMSQRVVKRLQRQLLELA